VTRQNSEQRVIGKYMMVGMWVLVLALAVFLVNRHLERQRNPNNEVIASSIAGKRSIELQRSRFGQYLVTGSINNAEVDFLVDTGASSVSIPARFADRIGLPRGAAIQISTANGIGVAYKTRVDQLRIGELEVRNVDAHINPGLSDEVLLGMSILRHYELIQRGDTLVIREP
jgi:aspartyl protease family protein